MADPDESLAFHASAPGGERGYVILIERPNAAGWVSVRRWESPDYTAPPVEGREVVANLRSAVTREAKAGWRFTLPLDRILDWLEPSKP